MSPSPAFLLLLSSSSSSVCFLSSLFSSPVSPSAHYTPHYLIFLLPIHSIPLFLYSSSLPFILLISSVSSYLPAYPLLWNTLMLVPVFRALHAMGQSHRKGCRCYGNESLDGILVSGMHNKPLHVVITTSSAFIITVSMLGFNGPNTVVCIFLPCSHNIKTPTRPTPLARHWIWIFRFVGVCVNNRFRHSVFSLCYSTYVTWT